MIRFSLRAECLNKNKLTLGRRLKYMVRLRSFFFTDQDFETEPTPCQMVAHATGSIGLNHGVNARGFERSLGKVGFDLRGKAVNDHEFAAIHAAIIRLHTPARLYSGAPQRVRVKRFFTLRCFVAGA